MAANFANPIKYLLGIWVRNARLGHFAHQVVAHPTAALTTATASQTSGATTTLMRAVRLLVNSGSGSALMTIVQQSTI
jgi:hypothetical protein